MLQTIDAGGPDLDDDVARPRIGCGKVHVFQDLGTTEAAKRSGFQNALLYEFKSN
jgi:hypothetical protein